MEQSNLCRTPSRESRPSGLDRVREVAKGDGKLRFTALLHHVTVDLLRSTYHKLKKGAAPGVDGVTWREYGRELEARLGDLHGRIHRGAYQARPSRRIWLDDLVLQRRDSQWSLPSIGFRDPTVARLAGLDPEPRSRPRASVEDESAHRPTRSLRYLATCSCVANQTPGRALMCKISFSSAAMRERWPVTWGCIVKINRPPSS